MDLTWDGVPFRPKMIETAVRNNQIRSSAMRSTLKIEEHPLEPSQNGKIGSASASLGSRQSSRRIIVYDRRGPVRLEFMVRNKRANVIVNDLVSSPIQFWSKRCVAHLRDYVDFINCETQELLPWWQALVGKIHPANLKLGNAHALELAEKEQWLESQVAPTLAMVADIRGMDAIKTLIEIGRERLSPKQEGLICKLRTQKGNFDE